MAGPRKSDCKMSDYSYWHHGTTGIVEQNLIPALTCAAHGGDHGNCMQALWQRGGVTHLLILTYIIYERGSIRE